MAKHIINGDSVIEYALNAGQSDFRTFCGKLVRDTGNEYVTEDGEEAFPEFIAVMREELTKDDSACDVCLQGFRDAECDYLETNHG